MRLLLELQETTGEPGVPAREDILHWAETALVGRKEAVELVVRVVDEAESQALNSSYRGKDRPTNVLSFPFDAPPGVPSRHIGDVVICASVVEREAREQGKALSAHWAHMVVHGVLHLLGYDHETDSEAEQMEALEIAILATLDLPDPYEVSDS